MSTTNTAKQHDPDAAWGTKTAKDGGEESFYGYHEHTLVRVPTGNQPKDTEPRLIARFELTPADDDIVEVSLSLLDRLPTPASVLIADRHYQYKAVQRWRDQLVERGIEQVFDLRADQHGFTELNHTRWAAGWPHCPATPDHYGTIPRPAANATTKEKQTFRRRINLRQQYAFRRVTSPDPDGTARWECPALAGSIGCPLRPGTVEAHMELGGTIIDNPPDPTSPDFPTCCSQRTITLKPGPLRKLIQTHYWGSETWEHEYAKRTYVEGSYGNRKNPSTEDLRRGHLRITGIAAVQVATAMSAAAYNLRILRNWHQRTNLGNDNHPLLQADQEFYGWTALTKQEAETRAKTHVHQPT
jgi:hypothetical protein